ncbi:energy transducer TonB [Azonexus sp.]|uniref:energy transducer TonB n=1 Tax=Azonexus sp. TaxID=1872668 RepID=UPI0035AEF2B8
MVAVNRRLGLIFGLSAALHATLFVAMAWQRKPAPAEPPRLVATLRTALAVVAAATPVSQNAEAPARPVSRAAAALPPKVRQLPSRAQPLAATRDAMAAGPANVPAVSAPAGAAAPAAAAAPLAAAEPSPAARPAGDALAGYRQRLAELFAGRQEYPRLAALRGWEGEVRLRLKVARKGNLLGIALDRSSGHDVLDRHALAMVEALAGLPPFPDSLDDAEIQVVVPVNYKLRKTT